MTIFKNQHTISELEIHIYSFFHIANKKKKKDSLHKKKRLIFLYFCLIYGKIVFFSQLTNIARNCLIIVSDVLKFGLRVCFQCRVMLGEQKKNIYKEYFPRVPKLKQKEKCYLQLH